MIVFAITTIIYTIYRKNCNHNFHKFIIYSYLRVSTAIKTGVHARTKPGNTRPVLCSKNRSEKRSALRPGSATHGYRRSKYETTAQAAPPHHCSRVRWPRFPHLALRPHPSNAVHERTFSNPVPSPVLKKSFGETFGAATGVSEPRLQKILIRNNGAGGQAANVAGYGGPGFH